MKESGSEMAMIHNKRILGDLSSWMFYIMILLAVSMPLSEFGMSISQFLLLGLWVYEGADFNVLTSEKGLVRHISIVRSNVADKFHRAFHNRALLVFLSIYIIHVAGLLYTSDFNYALRDLRVKLPLLSLPVLFATSKALDFKRFNTLLLFFCLSVIFATLVSYYVLFNKHISDPREISVFISHIRFALLICIAIFILVNFLNSKVYTSSSSKILIVGAIVWLIVFLAVLKSLTGIIISILLGFSLIVLFITKHKRFIIPAIITFIIIICAGWYYINDIYKNITVAQKLDLQTIDKFTALGNPYSHDTVHYGIEHGAYVGSYLSVKELRESWNKRSSMDYDGLDKKGQQLSYTLIRYLHSKGYRKDAEGVNKLGAEDIYQIENGVANADYLDHFNIKARIDQMLLGYRSYHNENEPNASSLMQRIEYWKTSFYLIGQKPLLGYGTGDLDIAFTNAYYDTHSKLEPEYRHRSHNQFLAITIAFGIVGLLVFLFALIYPPLYLNKFKNYYYFIFFIVAVISFLTEDTLETQAGATFFAYFSALLLFSIGKDVDEKALLG